MSMSSSIQRDVEKPCGCSSGAKCGCNSHKTPIASSLSRPNFFAGQMLTDEDLRDAMNYMVQKNRLHNRNFLGEGVVCGLQVVPHPCNESRGKVIVKKGHAINGCGDDILVIREHELDILQMVRERLVEKFGRSDCGDPCRDRQFDQADINVVRNELQELLRQREFALNGRKQEIEDSIRKNQAKLEERVRQATPVKYGLYVRYEEQMTDFVTPYQTDNCGTVSCQGSRIREGYTFELRCATQMSYPDLRSTLDACGMVIPNYESLQGQTLHGISTLETVQKVLTQFKAIEKSFVEPDLGDTPLQKLTDEQLNRLRDMKFWTTQYLALSLDDLRKKTFGELRTDLPQSFVAWFENRLDTAIPNPQVPFSSMTQPQLDELKGIPFLPEGLKALDLERIQAVTTSAIPILQGSTFSYSVECLRRIVAEVAISNLANLFDAIRSAISDATNAFLDANIPTTTSETNPIAVDQQRDAVHAAHVLLSLAIRAKLLHPTFENIKADLLPLQKLIDAKLRFLKFVSTSTAGDLPAVPNSVVDVLIANNGVLKSVLEGSGIESTFTNRAIAVGEILGGTMVKQTLLNLDRIKSILLGYMASGEISFSPELRAEMFGVSLGMFDESNLIDEGRLAAILRQAKTVNRAIAEVGKNCMCDALLPPCPTDTDGAVLLADITVSSCEVADICSLSRRMVVTGPSLRYWFSDFKGILDELRDSCCPSVEAIRKVEEREALRLEEQNRHWELQATGSQSEPTFVTPILKKQATVDGKPVKDFLDHIAQWKDLHAEGVNEVQRIAVSPASPGANLITLLGSDGVNQQALNIALARLATRPETDMRNVLQWTEKFSSPAEVRQIAVEAKNAVDTVKSTADAAISLATSVTQSAQQGIRDAAIAAKAASDAEVKAQKGVDDAALAAKAATDADAKAQKGVDDAALAAKAATDADAKAQKGVDDAALAAKAATDADAKAQKGVDDAVLAAKAASDADAKAQKGVDDAALAAKAATDADTKAQEAKDGLANKVNSATFTALRDAYAAHTGHPPG